MKLNILSNLRFSNKITLLGIASVLLTALTLLMVVAWQSGQYNAVAQGKVEEVTDTNLKDITRGAYNMVRAQGESVQQQVDYNLNVARYTLANTGQVSLSQEATELAMRNINQATMQSLASTRQAEKSAQSLNELARSLSQTVEQYQL